jgi:hypothetical protein
MKGKNPEEKWMREEKRMREFIEILTQLIVQVESTFYGKYNFVTQSNCLIVVTWST